jgi:hypothetical protein
MTRQLAGAEHIIAPGTTRKARVALLYSISSDLWQPWGYIHMLERRATYLALVHDRYQVDMLTEEDVAAGRLKDYDVLYVVDPNISARATSGIEQWVRGGYAFGSCGAGSRDEFNEPAPGLARVFGIEPAVQNEVHRAEYRVRGSLNGIDYVDLVRLDGSSLLGESTTFGVLGVRVTFTPTGSQVIGRFKRNNAPAAVVNEFGSGKAVYVGACPGLSYLKDAGFVPAELKERYPVAQRHLLTGMTGSRGVMRLVELSHPVVEAGVYAAAAGTALILANFTYRPIEASPYGCRWRTRFKSFARLSTTR